MPRLGWAATPTIVAVAALAYAQTPERQPRFRGGTDLVQVDVSVLDSRRQPVRGLTAADFTVLEDGQPREIQAFSEVDLPDRVQVGSAPWVRDAPRDVVTNQAAEHEGRLVVIVLDRSIPVGEPTLTAKRIALAAVSELGPDDLGAVVSTSGGATHNLTSDRSRLLRAINESDVSTGVSSDAREVEEQLLASMGLPIPSPLSDGRCLCGLCVLETITRVADAIQSAPGRRKSLFFIGSQMTLQSAGETNRPDADVGCESRLTDARNAMFKALDRANLTVHSLDPTGLNLVGPIGRTSSPLAAGYVGRFQARDTNEHLRFQGELGVLPERTGGRTVLNTNAPDLQVSAIFRESDGYYLIGFRPASSGATGQFHSITVKVNRRGLEVHARKGYVATPAPVAATAPPAPDALSDAMRTSLTGLLPGGRVPLDVNVATFATPGSRRSAVTLTVGVEAFRPAPSAAGVAGREVPLEIVASAFDEAAGREVSRDSSWIVGWPDSDRLRERRFDALSRLDLPPGDYEIRIGVSGSEPTRTASVFSYITVPDFDRAPLSMSSLVIAATAGTLTAPKDLLAALLPIVPTARRDFARTEKLLAFVRIYQGTSRQDALLPVRLRSSAIDAHDGVVASEAAVLEVAQFEKGRVADHYLTLPLASLPPGEYLLRLEAEMGPRTAGRALRFSVK